MTADEAQTQGQPKPTAEEPVTDDPREPEQFEFHVEIRMDATVSINGQDWIKPGATAGHRWRIRDGLLPSEAELKMKVYYIQAGVLQPVLEEMIELIGQRVAEAQINR